MMVKYLTLFLVFCFMSFSDSQFDPGCSFSNGQCLYNVRLGHAGQCDHSTRAVNNDNHQASGFQACSCKDVENLQQNVNTLWSSLRDLQGNMQTLGHQMNLTKDQMALKDIDISTLQGQKQNLSALLVNKDQLLTKSQAELANIVAQTTAELDRLRRELSSTNTDLTVCKSSLSILDAKNSTPPVLYGDYRVWYCPFEDAHKCNYTDEYATSSTGERWLQGSGRVNTQSGPIEDHTFGSPHGKYLYIDPYRAAPYSSSSSSHRSAMLISPIFQPAQHYCIRFWYTLYGSDIEDLNVYAKVGSGLGYPVLKMHGQVDKYWHMAEISLDHEYTGSPFRVVLEGTTSSYTRNVYTSGRYQHETYHGHGYIAIDDIFVYNTTCKSIPKCPANSRQFHDGNETSCYTFHVTPMTWYDAVMTCKGEAPNGHLVSVGSLKEQQFIVDTVQNDASLSAVGSYGWYSSGNDERVESHFVWTDTGYPYPLNYTDWHAGQPNNVGNVQQCLLLEYSDDSFEWGDVNCNDKHPFICEIKQ